MSIPPSVAVLSLLALAGGCAEPYPLDDELRVTDVQVIGTHNSYHVMINELDAWNYTHAPLDEQIRDLADRRVEQAGADAVGSDRDRLDVELSAALPERSRLDVPQVDVPATRP